MQTSPWEKKKIKYHQQKKNSSVGFLVQKAPFFLKGDLIHTFPFPTADIFSAFPFGHWVS